LLKKFFHTYSFKGIEILVSLIFFLLVTKNFGVEIYGQYILVISFVKLISNLFRVPTGYGIIFYGNNSKFNLNALKIYFHFIDVLSAILSISLIIIIFHHFYDYFKIPKEFEIFVFYYAIVASINNLKSTLIGVFQLYEKIKLINYLNILPILADILLLVLLFEKLNPLEVIFYAKFLGWTTSFILMIFTYIFFSKKKSFKIEYLNYSQIKTINKFLTKTYLNNILRSNFDQYQNLIINYFSGPLLLGVFNSIKKIMMPLSLLETSLNFIYQNKTNILISKNAATNEFKLLFKKPNQLVFIFSFLFLSALVFLNKTIMSFLEIQFDNILTISIMIALVYIGKVFQWWILSFSISKKINMTIFFNLFLNLYYLLIVSTVFYFLDFYGFIVSIFILEIFINLFWQKELKRI